MNINLTKKHYGKLWRAVTEFDLLNTDDRILIGMSGGKDSCFLAIALSELRKYSPRKFELGAINIDPLFTADFNPAPIDEFCQSLNIPFQSIKVNIAEIIEKDSHNDPCFTCSFFRHGAINKFARKNGFNKIAYAHHHDDAVETFFMSMLCSGRLTTFSPLTYLSRTDLSIIRPIIYFREREIEEIVKQYGFNLVKNPCPINGKTKRQEIKELINNLKTLNPQVYEHIAAAMRDPKASLWPPTPNREEMKIKHMSFWKK